jgi:hypothetical protein
MALENGETRSVRRDDFALVQRSHPGVNDVLLRLLAEQLRRASDRIIEAHYVDAETRVRRRLSELTRTYDSDVVPLTQEDLAAMAGRMLPEAAYAQRAAVQGKLPPDMAWLNANENPDGPPQSSIKAMVKVLPEGGRYHYQEFGDFYATVARSEDLSADQILIGAGSSEVLHAAADALHTRGRHGRR